MQRLGAVVAMGRHSVTRRWMHAGVCAHGSDHERDTFFEAGVASFEGLGLPAQLVQRLRHAGFERPSRLQAQVRRLPVSARTRTGGNGWM